MLTTEGVGMQTPGTSERVGELQPGRWVGEYIDATGQRATLNLSLREDAGGIQGEYELVFKTEDAPFRVAGQVVGKREQTRVQMEVPFAPKRSEKGDRPRMSFEARLTPAGSYARQALVGIVDDVPEQNIEGGVWVAWLFADRSDKEQ
jgi:hypothetical protein